MKELEKEFIGNGEVRGFLFKQIKANALGYVYEITDDLGKVHLEVFERKESKKCDYVIAGKAIHSVGKVRYPKSNSFGDWAWCIRDLSRAIQKFDELNKKTT